MIELVPRFELHQKVLVRELDATGVVYERVTADSGNKIYGVRLDEVASPKNFVATKVWHCPSEGLRDIVVCLSGSTRFIDAFEEAYIRETLKGYVVLTVAGNMRGRPEYEEAKPMLDKMYLHKIAMSDEVLVLNVGGYIEESTKREIAHAKSLGKRIRYLEGIEGCKS